MSQVKAPREFKFVGAFSRKRRSRKAPPAGPATGAKRRAVVTSTVPQEQLGPADAPAAPAPGSNSTDARSASEGLCAVGGTLLTTPTAAEQPTAVQSPPLATPLLVCEPNPNTIESHVLVESSNEGMSQGNGVGWSCSSLLNPFLDLGPSSTTPFHQNDEDYQFPICLAPDVPFIPSEDIPPTDDLESPQSDYFDTIPPSETSPADHASADGVVILPSLSSQQAPSNIGLTIAQLLNRYDQEFCVTPLTHDFDANPFRSDTKTAGGRGSQLLLHCILALSYKHINRDTGSCASEARGHKMKALQILQGTEKSSRASPLEATFLDALLILMTLDCATSAHGPWTWYLKRAYKMIQATESSSIQKTPRMQARIEMLVWWDVTLALTSRQGCVLSESTILRLFDHGQTGDETFYSVSGCPEALFRHMIRLGSYAREFELIAGMTCAKFDMGPVLQVRREIREWTDPEYGDFTDQQFSESSPLHGLDVGSVAQYREDLHHCAEAWRYGLLTYVSRVFEWRRDQPACPVLGFLARKTLNHVASCRASSTLQKQLLLPVFLAGCETADEHLRGVARSYCRWWNERTRYDMFLTAHALLEEVWSDESPRAWWGSVIDQKSRSSAGAGGARQYLFG